MSGNKPRFTGDPEGFDGNYVGAGDFTKVIENKYDIRAFAKFKMETGRSWADLSPEEQQKFLEVAKRSHNYAQ